MFRDTKLLGGWTGVLSGVYEFRDPKELWGWGGVNGFRDSKLFGIWGGLLGGACLGITASSLLPNNLVS